MEYSTIDVLGAEAARRIDQAIERHNLSAEGCANIIEAAAPLCDAMTAGGVVNVLLGMYRLYGCSPDDVHRESKGESA